jgi:hypothetical protein
LKFKFSGIDSDMSYASDRLFLCSRDGEGALGILNIFYLKFQWKTLDGKFEKKFPGIPPIFKCLKLL